MSNNILIIAGEASGDLHGSNLVQRIHLLRPGLEFWGIGGDKLAANGVELLFHASQLAFLGISEVIRHLPFIFQVRKKIVTEIKQRKPMAAILIDYPGFNLRIAKTLHELGIRVFYYIAPQVWAWGKRRVKKMARYIDLLAVILPFEKNFFKRAGVPVEFVGHPLLDILQIDLTREQFFNAYGLHTHQKTLVLLPGSRAQEINTLLPDMLVTAQHLRQKFPELQVLLSRAPTIDPGLLEQFITEYPFVNLVENHTYAAIHYADAALVASGTATLETACLGTPMAVVYRTHPITYHLARELISVKSISLVNIVAGKEIVPEFIQHRFEPDKVAARIAGLIFNQEQHQIIQQHLAEVRQTLGQPGAAEKAARLFVNLLPQ